MKKKFLGESVLLILICGMFFSCENFYSSTFDDSVLNAKTTIKDFSSLNEPIVISLPVYETLYLFGNPDMGTKRKQLGDIIAVIDVDTDSVYDWIYYPGEHNWSNWRLSQISEEPVCYVMSSYGAGQVAVLNTKGEMTVTKTDLHDFTWASYNKKDYVPICVPGASYSFRINLFNVKTNTIDKVIPMTAIPGYMATEFEADENGDFYFIYEKEDEETMELCRIDNENLEASDLHTFNISSIEEGSDVAQKDTYAVRHISDNKLYVKRNYLGIKSHNNKVLVVNKNTGDIEKSITLENDEGEYIRDICSVNGKIYALTATSGTTHIKLYEINEEEGTSTCSGNILDFDGTEYYYIRGTKIYFMCSRNTSDITFTWYDVESKQTGSVTRVCVNDFLK